jgi:hypothetical protein
VTGHFVQVNSPIDTGKTGIAAIDLKLRVHKRTVRAGRKIGWVGNIERADIGGYVSP